MVVPVFNRENIAANGDFGSWDGLMSGDWKENMYGSFLANAEEMYNRYRSDALADREYNAQREDTAYQRMVADLKAAGLNPWLAAGSSGSSSQMISNTSQAGSQAREIMLNLFKSLFEHNQDNLDSAEKTSKILKNISQALIPLGSLF